MDTNSPKTFEFHSIGQSQGHSFWLDVLIFIAVAVALYVVYRLIALMLSKLIRRSDSNR